MNNKKIQSVLDLLDFSSNFRVQVTLDEAHTILDKFPKYNNIPSNLAEIVNELKKKIGPVNFGPNNPNNGSWNNIKISIGNDYSLVVYVDVGLFLMPANNPDAKSISSLLESIGSTFSADEMNVEIRHHPMDAKMIHVEARFWWD